jgi:hypothetical protein
VERSRSIPKGKSSVIHLPLKITLTEDGVNWFIRNNRKLQRFRLADNVQEYGIWLDQFSATTFQKMLTIDYLSTIELGSPEFSSRRREIMDLSKLITYEILYKRFTAQILAAFLASPLIKKWNRLNPAHTLDESSKFDEKMMGAMLSREREHLPAIEHEIIGPLVDEIIRSGDSTQEEKQIQFYITERLLENLPKIVWCILSKSKTLEEYDLLLAEIRATIRIYLKRSRIAEYLALMIMELATNAEHAHLRTFAARIYGDKQDLDLLILNPQIRSKLLARMESEKALLHLTWKVSGSKASIGTEHRLRVILYNQESDYRQYKQEIEDKKGIDARHKNLFDFYKETPAHRMDTELGLYYLSYLHEACAEEQIRFESQVSQIPRMDLTVMTLSLNF